MNNIIELLRKDVIEDLFQTNTFNKCWNIWANQVRNIIGDNPTPKSILDLGDSLRDIFNTTGGNGRDQSELSSGGTAWECLIVWYLNLCFAGTRVVAFKKMSQVPSPIKDAIAVNYSNFSCTTESDITVVVFPDNEKYTSSSNLFLNKRNGVDRDKLSDAVSFDFIKFEIGIIQCKTNWNDNAQIPMLWDMIYSAGGFGARQISVGINNYSIKDIPKFTYSFVTVPSNKLDSYKVTSLAVKRVINLSGGNYWGLPTSNGIARSVKEIFQNYRSGYQDGVIKLTLQMVINELSTTYSYFNLKSADNFSSVRFSPCL